MARAIFDAGEVDPHDKIINGIAEALENSHRGRARTTLQAVRTLEVVDDEGCAVETTLDGKIAYICDRLHCTHELVEDCDEIVFLKWQN